MSPWLVMNRVECLHGWFTPLTSAGTNADPLILLFCTNKCWAVVFDYGNINGVKKKLQWPSKPAVRKTLKLVVLLAQFHQCWTSACWQQTSSYTKTSECRKPAKVGNVYFKPPNTDAKQKAQNSQFLNSPTCNKWVR